MNKPTFKGLLLGATALAVTSMPAVAGQDQDQVIRDLQQQLQALQQQVDTLKSQTDAVATSNREMYKSIRRVEQGATPPKMVSSGQKKFSLTVSGHVNRVIMFADNGNNSEVFYADNTNASTRWRFIGKGKINEDVSIGSRIEVELQSNPSASVSIDDVAGLGDSTSTNTFGERYADVSITSKSMGSVYLGQGDPFSNGIAEYDVSGTSAIAYSLWHALGGGMVFRNSATNASAGFTMGSRWNNMDGQSRTDRIRYNTPSFAGFSAGISSMAGGQM
ncbi:MAG: porin, partial [Dehalococcoidia bacterium]